jgi:uncharacterized protein YacL
MSRERILVLFGILIALSPFSGLPLAILTWILPLLGIVITLIGLTLASRRSQERMRITMQTSAESL